MARRVPRTALSVLAGALGLLLVAGARDRVRAADATPPDLVRFGFDDGDPVTGPDTLAVFEHARGRVRLSREIVYSGRRSIMLHDVAGDGDFPELQGFFPLRREGELRLSFAILVTDPQQELNVALAGPAGFRLGRDGIALWLATRDGALVQVSDSIPKRLATLQPFVWYRVEAVYRVTEGRYDLSVFAEGRPQAVVALVDQPNAANAPGSAVSLFSFIGDNGDDLSDVTYFVDDIAVAAAPFAEIAPFVAPGRRRLFVDRIEGYDEPPGVAAPSCPPALAPEDFGVRAGRGDAPAAVAQILAAAAGASPAGAAVAARPGELEGVRRWREGCDALARADFAAAARAFAAAAHLAPDAALYPLGQALALVGGGELDEAEILLGKRGRRAVADPRFGVVAARLAAARGFSGEAESWLESAVGKAESGEAARFAALGAFHWLMLERHTADARAFAARMAQRSAADAGERARWVELGGDAAFVAGDAGAARTAYEQALEGDPDAEGRLYLKLADVAHVQREPEVERRLREQIYGRLREDDAS